MRLRMLSHPDDDSTWRRVRRRLDEFQGAKAHARFLDHIFPSDHNQELITESKRLEAMDMETRGWYEKVIRSDR
jgi:hypothetical protein